MSMIEKFLENKEVLREKLIELRDEALKAAEPKANALIDEFIGGVKAMVVEATDEEFVAFLTSGKLDDEDIAAAIMFRAEVEAEKKHDANTSEEPDEKCGRHVHVFVVG